MYPTLSSLEDGWQKNVKNKSVGLGVQRREGRVSNQQVSLVQHHRSKNQPGFSEILFWKKAKQNIFYANKTFE